MLKIKSETYKGYKKTFLRKFNMEDIDFACNVCSFPQRIFVTSSEERLFDHVIQEHKEELEKSRR